MTVFFLSLRTAVDPDYGWHVANGRHFWDGVLFIGHDVYSWTAAGHRWVEPEWLSELMIASVNDTLGPTANSILASAIVTLTFALVALRLRRRGASVASTIVTVFLGFTASLIGVGVRVQMITLLFSAATLLLIDQCIASAKDRVGRLLMGVAGGGVLWANSHGSYPLLFVFLALTSAGLLIAKDMRWRWAAFATLVAIVAVLANPWTWEIYPFSLQSVLSPETKFLIEEWQRPKLGTFSFVPFDIELALIVLSAALVVRDRLLLSKDHPHLNEPALFDLRPQDALIGAAIVYLSLQSARHVMLVGICAAPVIANLLDRIMLDRIISNARERLSTARTVIPGVNQSDDRARDLINLSAVVAIVIALMVLWWPRVSPSAQRRAVGKRYPVGLLNAARSVTNARLCLFNEYTWGGFLEQHDVLPVFIDGRGELYGVPQMVRYGSIIHMDRGWQNLFDSLGVDAALLTPRMPLTLALRNAGWSTVAQDSVAALLLRPGRSVSLASTSSPGRSKCPRS